MKNLKLGVVGLVISSLALACGSARLVTRDQSGGVFALEGDRGKAMEDAQSQMAAHCGGPGTYQIVQEGEVVIGEDTFVQEDTSYGSSTDKHKGGKHTSGGSSTSASSSTRAATEWRVQYACVGAATAPAAPAPAPAPAPGPGAPGY
jgi:hypothetical protein